MSFEIVQIGHPTLREIAKPLTVEQIQTPEVQQFIDDLVETKREANGAGIAANQVAQAWRIYVVEVEQNPRYPYKPVYPLTIMINPSIAFLTEERFINYEGCLSIPDLRGEVKRCPHIRVTGLDRNANRLDFAVRGISAGTFQHEQDHLDGILFTDKLASTRSLCTWQEFSANREHLFRETVRDIVARYGS